MVLRLPLCLFNRHDPVRTRVKWDGYNFVGRCRFCKRDVRKEHHGTWRKDWMTNESSGKILALPRPSLPTQENGQAD
jgi:hypothetical protein